GWAGRGRKTKIDAEIEALTEEDDLIEQERFKKKWSTIEALVGSDKRIDLVAKDLVDHFEARTAAMPGKAMVVCMSRRICIKLHDAIAKIRPQWYSKYDTQGAIKVVMTGAASDPIEWQEHIGNKQRRDTLAIIFNGYPLTMFLSLPFCIIWAYCAWLHHEPQLKWLNLTFLAIYAVGIVRYTLHVGN
ncbi:MAG: type site-specific deoxyribonuclease, HsdR family protein, partial [Pseudomonadota bacterium]